MLCARFASCAPAGRTGNRSVAVTLVERVSRQSLIAALHHGCTADNTTAAVISALMRQPQCGGGG
ncbi:MAG: hypothetical protein OXC59_11000 [Acidimicrobiaceae bacterium]|nr:hypothetical protein [Acidimicrobiaceae bacterium]